MGITPLNTVHLNTVQECTTGDDPASAWIHGAPTPSRQQRTTASDSATNRSWGIFNAGRDGPMLERVAAVSGTTRFQAFDPTFVELE